MDTRVSPSTTPREPRLARLPGWGVVLGYTVLVAAWSLLLLTVGWPVGCMWFLCIPILLTGLRYPRLVHASMTLILTAIALWVSYRVSPDQTVVLEASLLAGFSVLGLTGIIHRLITAQRQVEARLQQRNQELAVLNAVTVATATLDLEQVLQRLVDMVEETFPQTMAATLQLLDEQDGTLRTQAASASVVSDPPTLVFESGRGIAGLALAERRLINVADVTTDPRYLPGTVPPRYRSLLVAPLVTRQRVWGTLSVAGKTPGAFQAHDERLVESLARQAAIAIENAHLYQETARRAQEQAVVARITRALNATLDVERAFPAVVQGLRNLFGCERVSLVLFNDERQELTVVVLDSPTSELGRGEVVPYSASPAIPDVKAGRAYLTLDLATENDYPGEQALYQAGFRSRVNLPLIVSDQVIGALNLTSLRLAAFTPDDLPPMQQVADALAAAIVNSQLHEETTRRLTQVHALAGASTHLTAHLEREATLTAVVEQAQAMFGADRVAVYLFEPQTHRFTWVHALGLSDEYLETVQRLYRDLPGYQAIMGKAVWVEETHDEDATGPLPELARREGYHTLVALPLWYQAQVVGGLDLYFDQRRAYDQALFDLAQAFANQAAIALENARLFDRVQTAEARYRALFEDSTDLIAIADTRGTFLDVNPTTCEMLGRPRQELVGSSAHVISGIPDLRFRQALERVLRGEILTYEFSIPAAGQIRHFEARVERIDYAGQVLLQWTAHDVTHQRELDHWREELSGIVVHNLRNPLTWVKSGTEMAHMFLPEDIDPDIPLALDMAIKGVDRLEQQIDVLLNINRAEAGQELADQDWLSVVQLAQEVIELLSPRAAAQKVQLQSEWPASLPMVSGNRNMLALMLENLVDNAIKYSPPGEIVHVQAQADHSTLRISVSDRGPGVPPGERERIFEKFYQVRRRRRRKGAGMGLYFCKLAVEAHGGKIWVGENSAGEGSTFVLTLPLQTDESIECQSPRE